MFDFPNSSAMDATASSGGPGTFLFQIVTGQPEQIAAHSAGLLQKATQFISLMDEFTRAGEQLGKVWSGQASDSAVHKITSSLQSFQKIIQVVQNGSRLLGISGTLVQSAQTAYKTVVASVNPTVASLMSNPWTYGAAVALSTATSASLRAFITAIEGLLQTLGAARLGQEIAALVSIITEIEKLVAGPSHAAGSSGALPTGSGSLPTNATISATPISMPQAPPPVATAAGQAAIQNGITNYTPPALAGFTNPSQVPGATNPNQFVGPTNPNQLAGTNNIAYQPPAGTPSIDPANSWIAVDPTATPPPTPTPPPASTPSTHVTIDVTTKDAHIVETFDIPNGSVRT
ncbi:MAG TPA: hypothetical protein VGD84_00320 [Pseudonocardiaceae bacterium]